jgi:hypothetical protein
VYDENLAWYLPEQKLSVCILVPSKAKKYLQSLGNKSKNDKIDSQGLVKMDAELCGYQEVTEEKTLDDGRIVKHTRIVKVPDLGRLIRELRSLRVGKS